MVAGPGYSKPLCSNYEAVGPGYSELAQRQKIGCNNSFRVIRVITSVVTTPVIRVITSVVVFSLCSQDTNSDAINWLLCVQVLVLLFYASVLSKVESRLLTIRLQTQNTPYIIILRCTFYSKRHTNVETQLNTTVHMASKQLTKYYIRILEGRGLLRSNVHLTNRACLNCQNLRATRKSPLKRK